MEESKKIYLDVCALARPFDDVSFIRIRLEAEAVNLILAHVHKLLYQIVLSPVHVREISDMPEDYQREQLLTFLKEHCASVRWNLSQIRARAEELYIKGLGIADAAHVAFAEFARADFITCDDRLIKKCKKLNLDIWVGNPIAFCEKEALR